jgi:hypothetical protein
MSEHGAEKAAGLKVVRDVTPDECWWLSETVASGTTVHRYMGHTYGVVGPGIAVTLEPGKTPFFELPRDAVASATPPEVSGSPS